METETRYIKYVDSIKYQLFETAVFFTEIYPEEDIHTKHVDLSTKGRLEVREDYPWDGASGGARDTKTIMRGSLLHDPLYGLLRQGHLDKKWRKQIDKEFKKRCIQDRMLKLRAYYVFRAVRRLAGFAADPKNKRRVHIAP